VREVAERDGQAVGLREPSERAQDGLDLLAREHGVLGGGLRGLVATAARTASRS
jgi:hypothetical protein